MPDELDGIINRMIDAGENDDDIAAVIEDYNREQSDIVKSRERNRFVGDVYKGPDTFWGGVVNSLNPFGGGEALKAGVEGAKGYARGAVADIPSSLMGAVSNTAGFAGDVLSDPIGYGSKVVGAVSDPMAVARGIGIGAQNVGSSIMQAGSNPEEFGRTVGQITGQPAVMGVAGPKLPSARTAIGATGRPVAATGRIMKQYQPISGVIPRIAESRTLRNIERGVGGLIETGGNKMRGYGATPPPQIPPVIQPPGPTTTSFNPPVRPTQSPVNPSRRLPPSSTSFYQGGGFVDDVLEGTPTTKTSGRFEALPIQEGETISDYLRRNGVDSIDTTPEQAMANRAKLESPVEEIPEIPVEAPENPFVKMMNEKNVPEIEVVDEIGPNASGESAASQEAISRNTGMRERGERYVVYDRSGKMRPLVGPDAVDFTPSRGETYGIQKADGTFIKLEDMGGKVTATRQITPKRREYPGFKGEK